MYYKILHKVSFYVCLQAQYFLNFGRGKMRTYRMSGMLTIMKQMSLTDQSSLVPKLNWYVCHGLIVADLFNNSEVLKR